MRITVDIKGDKRTPGVWDKPCIADTDCPFIKRIKITPIVEVVVMMDSMRCLLMLKD